ncbi:hypothetical protein MTR_2g010090 [Medicago truncatula]|uniref:Uncharacterized protein n=1 Tax=Medicago truncatula TaxID=3880 RepID=G7ISA2_MEDTR|nr:hypothetical protein MTR_2g010090 [Medicago truncatula]
MYQSSKVNIQTRFCFAVEVRIFSFISTGVLDPKPRFSESLFLHPNNTKNGETRKIQIWVLVSFKDKMLQAGGWSARSG